MSFFGRLTASLRNLFSPASRPAVQGRYDAAQTTRNNQEHWQWADGFHANVANSLEVRQQLRNRSRYEFANNSYANGIIKTLANDTVGTGPRLQVVSEDDAFNAALEARFNEHSNRIGLAGKLRTMDQAWTRDGEAFGRFITNPRISDLVQLDLLLLEADQVSTPDLNTMEPTHVDGIIHDENMNPVEYHVLKSHPGDNGHQNYLEYDHVAADLMVHLFDQDRPGQARGVPIITSSLPLFALLRRYTLATVTAAETAADFALVVQTQGIPIEGDIQPLDSLEEIQLRRGMATVLPEGWHIGQAKPEQPTNSYVDFKQEILNEIARCVHMPRNIALGNSQNYNYASGRLDHQTYHRFISVRRHQLEQAILRKLFFAWFDEAIFLPNYIPREAPAEWSVSWHWDGFAHVDPVKEATAAEKLVAGGLMTRADYHSTQGKDWEKELRQAARERALMLELGLNPDPQQAPVPVGADDRGEDGED